MTAYKGRLEFRTAPWVAIVVTLGELLFLLGAWSSYHDRGFGRSTLLFIGLAVFGVLGIVEVLTARIVLAEEALYVAKLWTRRSYPRNSIRRVTYEKGAPVALELSDGGWAKLPDLGHNSQSITNSIRAWLKATG